MSSPLAPGWALDRPSSSFPSPFFDMASTVMPVEIYNAMRWAEFLVASDGTFLSAISRVVAYFMTSLIIGDDKTNQDEQHRWLDFATEDQDVLAATYLAGIDGQVYGNSYLSVIQPFRRYLFCKNDCGASYTLDYAFGHEAAKRFGAKFTTDGKYVLTCLRCGARGPFRSSDLPLRDFENFRMFRWSPHEIEVRPGYLGSKPSYRWRIPQQIRQLVRSGRLDVLRAFPQEYIDTIVQQGKDFEFSEGSIIHFSMPTLSGLYTAGMGFPPPIHHLRHTWLVRMLNRQNEAISADWVTPMRWVTPEKAGPGDDDDIIGQISMDSFSRRFQSMVNAHRRDPTVWLTSPVPIKYQIAGGEAKNLVPHELLDQAYSVWMDAIGAPIELFKGNLSTQALAQGLRLFESRQRPFVSGLNSLIKNIFKRFSTLLRWQPVRAKLDSVTFADDLEKKSVRLQLAAARLISPSSLLQGMGLSYPAEQRQLIEDDKAVAELQKEVQKETAQDESSEALILTPLQRLQLMQTGGQEQALQQMSGMPVDPAQASGPPAGGGAAPAGASAQPFASSGGIGSASDFANMNPKELSAEGDRLAGQIATMDPSTRRSELSKLKQRNELMWSIVSKRVEQYDNQAKRLGKQQFMARFQQGAAPAA